ncbi:MAG: phosphate signaling complex protein PhoU [Actinomycetia bacterium]|nr:phosphate signaling complex protein PhoU [Actinomycetes bacterium]
MTGDELRIEYHQELDNLKSELVRLGAMTAETVGMGTAVLLDRDLAGAQRLIDGDDAIDELSLQLEEECFRLLALQQPMAGDLRMLLTTLRVISELERSADLMVNVCKASRRVYDLEFTPKLRGLIEQMGVEAAFLIRTAIDSFVDADTSLAAALDDIDDRLDDLQISYVEAIFESHQVENLSLRGAVQLALIGRYYERVGDHAVNIGERVIYMVTGWLPESNAAARNALRSANSSAEASLGVVPPPDEAADGESGD